MKHKERSDEEKRATNLRIGDLSALEDGVRFGAEELGLPDDQIGQPVLGDAADQMRHAANDGRIASVLGQIAKHANIVIISLQR